MPQKQLRGGPKQKGTGKRSFGKHTSVHTHPRCKAHLVDEPPSLQDMSQKFFPNPSASAHNGLAGLHRTNTCTDKRPRAHPAGLGKLLACWKEEALHLALEALSSVVARDAEAAARWEPHITPPLLQIWAHNFSDPLVALDTVDIFNSLASIPAALPALQVRTQTPQPQTPAFSTVKHRRSTYLHRGCP